MKNPIYLLLICCSVYSQKQKQQIKYIVDYYLPEYKFEIALKDVSKTDFPAGQYSAMATIAIYKNGKKIQEVSSEKFIYELTKPLWTESP